MTWYGKRRRPVPDPSKLVLNTRITYITAPRTPAQVTSGQRDGSTTHNHTCRASESCRQSSYTLKMHDRRSSWRDCKAASTSRSRVVGGHGRQETEDRRQERHESRDKGHEMRQGRREREDEAHGAENTAHTSETRGEHTSESPTAATAECLVARRDFDRLRRNPMDCLNRRQWLLDTCLLTASDDTRATLVGPRRVDTLATPLATPPVQRCAHLF
jgi:hypothetical protein